MKGEIWSTSRNQSSYIADTTIYLPLEVMNYNWLTLDGIGMKAFVYDISTLNNTPHIVSEGYHGNALQLKYGQYIDFGENNDKCLGNLDLCPNGFSVAMWIKLTGTIKKEYFFSNALYFRETAGIHARFVPQSNMTGVVARCFNKSVTYSAKCLYPKRHVWHHIAVTCNLETGIFLYVDGHLQTSDTNAHHTPIEPHSRDANMTIGRSAMSVNEIARYHLEAIVDEIYIHEVKLEGIFIKELYELC